MKYLLSLLVLVFSSLVLADSTFFDDPNNAFVMGPVAAASAEAPSSQPAEGSGGSGCAQGQIKVNGTCKNEPAVPISNETTVHGKQETKEEETPPAESTPAEETGFSQEMPTEPVNESRQLPPESETERALFIVSVVGITVVAIVFIYLWWRQRKSPKKIY